MKSSLLARLLIECRYTDCTSWPIHSGIPMEYHPVHVSKYQAGTLPVYLLVGLFIELQDTRTIVPLQFTKYWYPEEHKLC